jgi:selenocysteine lyase/cysteine desulfurase
VLAKHFSRFFAADPERLHFAAHSHHPWPDATQAAHLRYWQDSVELADRKWERVLGEVVPDAQKHVARLLSLSDYRQVAFAPNTHEFVSRIYSCLDAARPIRVLTSAHEFHSFRRQTRRLVEAGRLEVEEIPESPWASFADRFVEALRRGPRELVWLSHVLFDSGLRIASLRAICAEAPPEALVVIDGYHAFCAVEVDLSSIHRRAFYIGGGYKYAMAGEGACFLAIPPGCELRPVDTGWYASFDTLSAPRDAQVAYSSDAFRFWGATFDPSGLYRFNASMDWLASTGKTIADVHSHSRHLQDRFLAGLEHLNLDALSPRHLVPPARYPRGNFLAFDIDDAEKAHKTLAMHDVVIDRRDRRLRFGFGVYHDDAAVDRLLDVISGALR